MGLDQLNAFMAAIRKMESGGNYKIKGPSTKYGRATGAYQFLDSTWGGYGGYASAYLAPPAVQDKRAAELMTGYFNQFGSWYLVAVAWHGGPGAAAKEKKNPGYAGRIGDQNMTTAKYANNVISAMGGAGGGAGQGAQAGGGYYGSTDFGSASSNFNAAEAKDRAKELYGYLGWFVDHPEIGPILLQAAQEGWSQERLQGALSKTAWWHSTSERSRQWDALKASDYATWERHIDETSTSLRLKASQLGIPISNGRSEQIADKALRFGWNEQELGIALAAEMRWRPGGVSERGGVGKLMQNVRKIFADAMVPLTQRQEWEWARRIVAGGADENAVTVAANKLAKARFPYLSKEIDAGVTPGQFFAPYRNVIAQTLELSPDDVNLMDTGWQAVLSFKDGKTIRPMTMSEAQRYARSKPGWLGTKNAWDTTTEAAGNLLEIFGAM